MRHPLPRVLPRDLGFFAVITIFLCFVASPATAQDSSERDHHPHFRNGSAASLHLQVHIVSYSRKPPRHHHDEGDDSTIVYNMPSRDPAMSVTEEERALVGRVVFAGTVIDAGQGAVLKTTTVVPE